MKAEQFQPYVNVLQLNICDEDTFSKDDDLYTVLFDVAKLHPGKTSRVTFKLNPQTWEELEIEFSLQYMAHRNGHRMAPAATNTNTNTGFLASASRWANWFRRIDIPRPPGF
uniref:Uncharacterized protein n=1 Tax=Sphaerodactylus townsendi TaxID=933632 RepID=A0ACB8G4V7_9SAUR